MNHIYKVILIDRDDANRSLICDLIGVRYKNIRVLSHKKAESALESLKKEEIDMALVEISVFIEQSQNFSGINGKLVEALNDVPCVTITPKNTTDKNGKDIHAIAVDNLNKPFKPASLYLILDKYLFSSHMESIDTEEFIIPKWAVFQFIDIRILCQTYSCDKDKVVKILKLYPHHVQTQLENMSSIFKTREVEQLYELFQSLRTSFLYFSKPEVMKIVDSIVEHIEKPDLDAAHTLFMLLKEKWVHMSNEIEII